MASRWRGSSMSAASPAATSTTARTVGAEHASANALDISGFRLVDGRRIRLATDWAGESADGRFLRRVRDGACASFNAVLGPDYNAAHRDHFHLDMGLWKVCR